MEYILGKRGVKLDKSKHNNYQYRIVDFAFLKNCIHVLLR